MLNQLNDWLCCLLFQEHSFLDAEIKSGILQVHYKKAVSSSLGQKMDMLIWSLVTSSALTFG